MARVNPISPVNRFLIGAASFVVVAAGLQAAQELVVPFLLALLIAMIFSPLVGWLHRHHLPAWLSILLTLLLILLIGSLIGMIVGRSVNSFLQDIPEYQRQLENLTADMTITFGAWEFNLSRALWQENINPGAVLRFAGNALTSLGNLMTNAFLIVLTILFLLGEALVFQRKINAALGSNNLAIRAVKRIGQSTNRYMALKALVSLGTGALVFLLVWSLNIDYPGLWALLAFLLNFVPNLGSLLAAVPAVLLALVQHGPLTALSAALGYIAINTTIGNLIEPKLMGRDLNLSTLVVFMSLVFWGYILGPMGMLLSVPLTMMVKITLESIRETRWIAIMLGPGDEQPPASDT